MAHRFNFIACPDASQEVKSHRVDRVTKAVSRAGNKVKQEKVERKQNRIY